MLIFIHTDLDRLLSAKISSKPIKTKSIDGMTNTRIRYSEQLNDFFIEEVFTPPKSAKNQCLWFYTNTGIG